MFNPPYRHIRCYEPDGRRIEDEYLSEEAALDAHRAAVRVGRALISKVIASGELTTFAKRPEPIVIANWHRGGQMDG